ncbi:glycosyltransferase family 2 protein [Agrococcus sp. Marseille-P2731]|uniref:glycosyltransferase family 2 protein n=1 Tax=Agrococcus sp. Marseille-P2731 TaxID=1841862 RepID=UPI000931F1B7|nr:glycosyltransferase family 2 protein [Agrococcus sp. Marseille-P2731]
MTLRIAVGIPTFRRPDRLAALLAAMPARAAEVAGELEVVVIVVDNDPSGSARDVVRSAPMAVRYGVEPTPGIAAVRNRLLDEAGDCDAIAFIDDDEVPLPGWLSELVTTWRRTGAAAVMGRVISIFGEQADPWVLATGVFRRRSRPTGLELQAAACGNLLVDLAQARAAGVRFDATLGLAGGEDTLFSKQLIAAGGRIVWCDESHAQDAVPAERVTRSWAMRRAYNGGNSAVHVEVRLQRGSPRRAAVRARRLLGGASRAGAGWVRHGWGRLSGDLVADARGLRTAYRGLGMMTAAWGHVHREYSREQGATS